MCCIHRLNSQLHIQFFNAPILGCLTSFFTFSMLLNEIALSQLKANIYRENNDQKDA
ncbi:putative membrane protein [Pectobacterium atrosepticum SCRI1043]|uniref:Membrane protein n=1 Tax=Pectobacterium atrosepticum (strain SCRI 1043 / ATCC BAA-672) TaxID=218491 RepID=Q6D324_PECAS|nr:putative membrane protein [Pectobacterium atrosepticum SCRI1043]